MVTVGLLFELEAARDGHREVASFLDDRGGLADLIAGLPMTAWFALQFDETRFGLLIEFEPEQGQVANIGSELADAIWRSLGGVLSDTPVVHGFDVLSSGVVISPDDG
jgi:hypothetical protein